MQEISRRAVLIGAGALTIALSIPASTGCAKSTQEEDPPSGQCKTQGNMRACISARALQDVTAIRYEITNSGKSPLSVYIWYVDENSGRESRKRTVVVPAGDSVEDDLYGSLKHCFTVNVCPIEAGECVKIGPVCAE
ncbi:MAG: hypothetical protein HOQ05_08130 [Corynebacteriales bacterium]|nr:hypothetical protein [Mycobacteriales bacterium]